MPPIYSNLPATSPITNCWGDATVRVVDAEHREIFHAHEGAYYNHHAQLASWNGRLIASWSQGDVHEDDVGQRLVVATSDDGGLTWSDPVVIADADPRARGVPAGSVTAEGFHRHGASIVAYYGWTVWSSPGLQNGHRPLHNLGDVPDDVHLHADTHTGAIVSRDGGLTWSAPRRIVERGYPNLEPQPTASGRLILPGNLVFPHTDDPTGLEGWRRAGLPRLPADYVDDPEGHHKGCRARGDARGYCEGSFFQTDDGVLHMMLRSNTTQLAVTESRDDGETWSDPEFTSYTDSRCRHQFGRLPDGRFFGLSCPDPTHIRPGLRRTPLVLATSEDGVAFDRHYILGAAPEREPRNPGLGKTGRYGYPHMHILDDRVHVIYSVHKEDMAVCQFPLGALQ